MWILRLRNLKNCCKCVANLRNCGCGPHHLLQFCGICGCGFECKFAMPSSYQRSKGLLPTHLSSIFTDISSIHSRSTRSLSQKKLYIPKFSTSCCQSSICYQGSIIWNSLSHSLRNLFLKKFKSKLKDQLLEKYTST